MFPLKIPSPPISDPFSGISGGPVGQLSGGHIGGGTGYCNIQWEKYEYFLWIPVCSCLAG